MNAQNASAVRYRDPVFLDDPYTAVIADPGRLAPAYQGTSSVVGDSRWNLTGLLHKHTVTDAQTINFGTFPDCYQETAKRLVWACINISTPVAELDRPTAIRTQLSAGSVMMFAVYLRTWMQWLIDQDISALCEVTGEDYEKYTAHIGALGIERSVQANRLFAVTRTWLYAPYLPETDRLQRPCWEGGGGRTKVLGEANWSAENRTSPIHPQTMSALLLWSMRFVNDFSDDILAARRMKDTPPVPSSEMTDRSPHSRFKDYMQRMRESGRTVPGWYPPNRPGQRCLATGYIGWQLGLTSDEAQAVAATRLAEDLDPIDEANLPLAITGTIDTEKWIESINFYEVDNLCRHLAAASFIVVAYLTGMRGEECRALEHGCCETSVDPRSGQTRHAIYGKTFKGALDADGNTIPEGVQREHPWRAIAPVAKAVAVMEALEPASRLLFPSLAFSPKPRLAKVGGVVSSHMLRDRISDLVTWCNQYAERHDRHHEVIAADPDGPVTVRRFRRTLAWFVYRKPGGRIALGVQYGHLRGHSTDGYGSRVSSGLRDVFPMEEALATAEFLEGAYNRLEAGEQVTGPAAKRYTEGIALYNNKFGGRYLTSRQAAALRSNPKLRIYDSEEQFVTCCYDQSKALCHPNRQTARSIEQTPDVTNCRPNCGNIARTDANIARAEAAVSVHRAEIADQATPLPIRARLEQRTATLQSIIDEHRGKRMGG